MQPPSELNDIASVIPDIILDIRYATADNFTGRQLYNHQLAWLRHEPLEKLVSAAAEYREYGYRMIVFDAYRSPSVQRKLRKANDDRRYVAETSNHCRGITVDVSLADEHGIYLDMGTDYDEFTSKAHRHSREISQAQASNRQLLAGTMEKYGFVQHQYEWWHFDYMPDKGWGLIDDELNAFSYTTG